MSAAEDREDEPEALSVIFNGEALQLAITGRRTGAGSGVRLARLTRMLNDRGSGRLLVDIRRAEYGPELDAIAQRVSHLSAQADPWRVALRVQDPGHAAAQRFTAAFEQAGHQVLCVRTLDQAAAFLIPRQEIHLID